MTSKQQRPIGIFDSGVGGLTVARAVKKQLPQEALVYFGDTAYLPYGDQPGEIIAQRAQYALQLLRQQQCKLLLIACNSAAAAVETLGKVPPRLPVLDVIAPVANYLLAQRAHTHVGVLGTRYTIQSGIYAQRLVPRPDLVVTQLATPALVPLIEAEEQEGPAMTATLEAYLAHPSLQDISLLVLGCTHYEVLRPQIEAFYAGRVTVLDAAQLAAQVVATYLQEQGLAQGGGPVQDRFLVSRDTPRFDHMTRLFFGEEVQLEEVV